MSVVPSPERGSEEPSPLVSETETDDTGITFVPKRASGSPPRRSLVEKAELSSSSDGTLCEDVKLNLGTPEKPGTPRQGGLTITESELMRRRRLLDSHIFEKDV